jgi:hypothetical protein
MKYRSRNKRIAKKCIVPVSNKDELIAEIASRKLKRAPVINGFFLCSEDDKEMKKFIRAYWNQIDIISGKNCDIYTVIKKNEGPQLVDWSHKPIRAFPTAQMCEDIIGYICKDKKSVKYPCIILFDIPKDKIIVRNWNGLLCDEIHSQFQELMRKLQEYGRKGKGLSKDPHKLLRSFRLSLKLDDFSKNIYRFSGELFLKILVELSRN